MDNITLCFADTKNKTDAHMNSEIIAAFIGTTQAINKKTAGWRRGNGHKGKWIPHPNLEVF